MRVSSAQRAAERSAGAPSPPVLRRVRSGPRGSVLRSRGINNEAEPSSSSSALFCSFSPSVRRKRRKHRFCPPPPPAPPTEFEGTMEEECRGGAGDGAPCAAAPGGGARRAAYLDREVGAGVEFGVGHCSVMSSNEAGSRSARAGCCVVPLARAAPGRHSHIGCGAGRRGGGRPLIGCGLHRGVLFRALERNNGQLLQPEPRPLLLLSAAAPRLFLQKQRSGPRSEQRGRTGPPRSPRSSRSSPQRGTESSHRTARGLTKCHFD